MLHLILESFDLLPTCCCALVNRHSIPYHTITITIAVLPLITSFDSCKKNISEPGS